MAQLRDAINNTGTPGADTFIQLSTADRNKLINAGVVATYAAHVLTVTSQGSCPLVYTPTGTSYCTVNTTVAHCWFGQYGCTDLVIQSDVSVQMNKEPLLTGYNYLCWTLYGIKTFVEGANRSIRVLINA
jgi:hypothetical protein